MIGWVGRVVALPVSGPLRGTMWVADQLAARAEHQLYDEDHLTGELAELARAYEAGELSAAEHDELESAVLERLAEARRRQREHHDPAWPS